MCAPVPNQDESPQDGEALIPEKLPKNVNWPPTEKEKLKAEGKLGCPQKASAASIWPEGFPPPSPNSPAGFARQP